MAQLSPQALPAGHKLGSFTIVRTLGQGGFGITYLAKDDTLDTDVVIKENLPLAYACRLPGSPEVHPHPGKENREAYEWAVQNFLNEARTLAKLRHPNIVTVLQAFVESGTAYYVMPYIEGYSLDTYRQKFGIPAEAWLRELLSSLLPALDYLHGKGLLHRDLKPANILMTAEGVPQLIDFGAARQLISEKTQTIIGSPGFTPIEQMQSHGNIGAWSDIYALGSTLYNLITGEIPPLRFDMLKAAGSALPLAQRPALRARYSEALLASIDKAMAFLPQQRWQTAAEWARSLLPENATAHETPRAAHAAPEHPLPELPHRNTARKFPYLTLSLALGLLLLGSGGYAVYEQLRQAKEREARVQAQLAEVKRQAEEQRRAEEQHHAEEQRRVEEERLAAEARRAEEARLAEEARQAEVARLEEELRQAEEARLAEAARRAEEARLAEEARKAEEARQAEKARRAEEERQAEEARKKQEQPKQRAAIARKAPFTISQAQSMTQVAYSPCGTMIAAAGLGNTIRLWDLTSLQAQGEGMQHWSSITDIVFSPDGKTLASCGWDHVVRLWDVKTQRPLHNALNHGASVVNNVAFSPDGRCLATCADDHTVRLWDVETGKLIGAPLNHLGMVEKVAFSPDGRKLATGSKDKQVCLWNVETRQQIGKAMRHEGAVTDLAFSPDGRRLATSSWDNTIRLWNVATQQQTGNTMLHRRGVMKIEFSPDGRYIAASCWDSNIYLWNAKTQQSVANDFCHERRLRCFAFSPDSRLLVTVGEDKLMRFWKLSSAAER